MSIGIRFVETETVSDCSVVCSVCSDGAVSSAGAVSPVVTVASVGVSASNCIAGSCGVGVISDCILVLTVFMLWMDEPAKIEPASPAYPSIKDRPKEAALPYPV